MFDEIRTVPGAAPVQEVLRTDPLFRIFGVVMASPLRLGIILFVIVVAAIVFGPASESRFIYTDF
jgi:hypothetical protein